MQASIQRKRRKGATANVMFRCDQEFKQALKQAALDRQTSIQAICLAAVANFIKLRKSSDAAA